MSWCHPMKLEHYIDLGFSFLFPPILISSHLLHDVVYFISEFLQHGANQDGWEWHQPCEWERLSEAEQEQHQPCETKADNLYKY